MMRWWRALKRRIAIEFPDEPETAVHAINNLTYTLHNKFGNLHDYEATHARDLDERRTDLLERIAFALEALAEQGRTR